MLSRLRHPCVVRLLGACLAPPDLCIVEELVEGGSLHAYLHGPGARRGAGDDGGRASKDDDVPVDVRVSTALDVCSDVARAMAYLAARGVTHRDLKSQNVLLVFPERAARGKLIAEAHAARTFRDGDCAPRWRTSASPSRATTAWRLVWKRSSPRTARPA